MDINTIKKLYGNNSEINKVLTHPMTLEQRLHHDNLLNEKLNERYSLGIQIYVFGYYDNLFEWRVEAHEYTEKIIRNPLYRYAEDAYIYVIDADELLDSVLETIRFYELLENPQIKVFSRRKDDDNSQYSLRATYYDVDFK